MLHECIFVIRINCAYCHNLFFCCCSHDSKWISIEITILSINRKKNKFQRIDWMESSLMRLLCGLLMIDAEETKYITFYFRKWYILVNWYLTKKLEMIVTYIFSYFLGISLTQATTQMHAARVSMVAKKQQGASTASSNKKF